jgi:isoquinoline 1-oxidoreductase beta subunit
LRATVLATGGFALGTWWEAGAAELVGGAAVTPREGQVGLNAWVRITPDNTVTIIVSQAEIGQGISTTLPAILVDELGADWSKVRTETAPYDPAYANPKYKWMFTGNSESIQSFHDLMRTVGASARTMLLMAASQRWGVPVAGLRAQDSYVIETATGRQASFGELATAASKIAPPEKPALKPDADMKLVGRALPRVDVPAKVDGSAVFGIDFKLPGMLTAAVRTAPAVGSTLELRNAEVLQKQPGVVAVVPVAGGFAVVADTYWRARSAMAKADTQVIAGPNAELVNRDRVSGAYKEKLDNGPFAIAVDEGQAANIVGAAKTTLQRDYFNPFLAHATMEPMNCVAHVTESACVVWGPLQGQNLAWYALQQALGMTGEQVQVNRTPYIGGGFGRRLLPDFVVQTALVSKAVKAPVKLIWDREEDMRRDAYRPATAVRLTATLGPAGLPEALVARVVSPTIISPVAPFLVESIKKSGIDPSAMEGMAECPYAIANRQVAFHLMQVPVPTSVMRTTGFGPNVFALESFIDELAHTARQDPIAYRRRLLGNNPRALHVMDRAAELAGWGKHKLRNEGLGVAVAFAFGSYIAQVVRVRVADHKVKLIRVVSVVDPGRVLDPMIAASAIEGGVVFGLAGCKSEVTFLNGAVQQDNFDTYAMPYLSETPELVTEFLTHDGPLGGLGEVSPVTLPPALANAIFAASGIRVSSMPLSKHQLQLI